MTEVGGIIKYSLAFIKYKSQGSMQPMLYVSTKEKLMEIFCA